MFAQSTQSKKGPRDSVMAVFLGNNHYQLLLYTNVIKCGGIQIHHTKTVQFEMFRWGFNYETNNTCKVLCLIKATPVLIKLDHF